MGNSYAWAPSWMRSSRSSVLRLSNCASESVAELPLWPLCFSEKTMRRVASQADGECTNQSMHELGHAACVFYNEAMTRVQCQIDKHWRIKHQ